MENNKARPTLFPFSAIYGQEELKLALLACAVDPSIGGVLIRGEKGTGKTTIVRALAQLLPSVDVVADCPYSCNPDESDTIHQSCRDAIRDGSVQRRTVPVPLVELPLNATEDRLAGTINLADSLRDGVRRFQPGLLAAANRGILYIDEVNLLEDHLVDLVLDAAATGVNRVEREGFSEVHPARFLLVGTMNPEEGELRPQFLDRFALSITVTGENSPGDRKEIARRRLAFEADRGAFFTAWDAESAKLQGQIISARKALSRVELDEEAWDIITTLSAKAGVQGHRSDIVMAKTAAALSALAAKVRPGPRELERAARLTLLHRIAGSLDDTPESVSRELEELLDDQLLGGRDEGPGLQEQKHVSAEGGLDMMEEYQVPGPAAAGSILFNFDEKKKASLREIEATGAIRVPEIPVATLRRLGKAGSLRRNRRKGGQGNRGRVIGHRELLPGDNAGDIHISATLDRVLERRLAESTFSENRSALSLKKTDIRIKVKRENPSLFILFLLDTSDSMGAVERMAVTKASVLALLQRAYQSRHTVALISFGGTESRLLLKPTRSVLLARKALDELRPDGGTPLAAGLSRAVDFLKVNEHRYSSSGARMVIISDGEGNLSMGRRGTPLAQALDQARRLKRLPVEKIFIDTKLPSVGKENEMRRLQRESGGRYLNLSNPEVSTVLSAVEG